MSNTPTPAPAPPQNTPQPPAGLVNAERLRCIIWPDQESRPSLRFLRSLQAKRLIPFRKISRLVMFDPVEVRRALDSRFTVAAR